MLFSTVFTVTLSLSQRGGAWRGLMKDNPLLPRAEVQVPDGLWGLPRFGQF